jgi:hypothetical protein
MAVVVAVVVVVTGEHRLRSNRSRSKDLAKGAALGDLGGFFFESSSL